jgi:hypothetical protein
MKIDVSHCKRLHSKRPKFRKVQEETANHLSSPFIRKKAPDVLKHPKGFFQVQLVQLV